MIQRRQNVAFHKEPLKRDTGREQCRQKFQGDAPVKLPVVAFRQPDYTHAAMAQFANKSVRPDVPIRGEARSRFGIVVQYRHSVQKCVCDFRF